MRLRVPTLHPGEHEVSSIEHIRAGRLRALAVTTATRSDQPPDIPTAAESVPGYEASYWAGIGNAHHAAAAAIDFQNISKAIDRLATLAGLYVGQAPQRARADPACRCSARRGRSRWRRLMSWRCADNRDAGTGSL